MAHPVVEAVAESSVNTAGTSHAVTLPAGIVSTDDVIILMDIGSTAATLNALTDWTEYLDENLANGLKIIRHTGAGVPSAPTFTSSASTRSAHITFRISGVDKSVAPLVGTTASGTSANPDPPQLSAGTGLDYLFIVFFGMAGEEADDDTWANTPPTNYGPTPPYQKSCGTAGTNLGGLIGAATRQLTTSSVENPGPFNVDVSAAWRAQTIRLTPLPTPYDGPQVTVVESAWNTATTPKTATDAGALTGDLLVALGGGDQNAPGRDITAASTSTSAGTTGSWTELAEELGGTSDDWFTSAEADVTGDGSVTAQMARTSSDSLGIWGFLLARARDHGGIGNVATQTTSGSTQVVSLTVSEDSAVVLLAVDWDAGTVGTAWVPSTDVELIERAALGDYTVHAAWWKQQPAGTRNYGFSGAGGTRHRIVAVEILAAVTGADKSGSDSGTLSDASLLDKSLAGADSGTASDVSQVAAAASGVDSGTLSDASAVSVTEAKTASDSATAGDSSAVSAAVSGADSGALADAAALQKTVDGADLATASDASSVGASPSVSDAASTSESSAIGLDRSDQLQASETSGLTADRASSDSLAQGDASAVAREVVPSDSAVTSETGSLASSLAGADSFGFTEASYVSKTVAGVDQSTLSEVGDVTDEDNPDRNSAETHVLGEASTTQASTPASDSAVLGETTAIAGAAASGDSASLTEQGEAFVQLAAADSATMADASDVGKLVGAAGADSASLTEASSVTVTLVAQDAAVLSESAQTTAALQTADSAQVLDAALAHNWLTMEDEFLLAEVGVAALQAAVPDFTGSASVGDLGGVGFTGDFAGELHEEGF